MAIEYQSGVVTTAGTAINTDTTISLSGFSAEPQVALFWISGRTESVDTVGAANHDLGFGVASRSGGGSLTARWAIGNQVTNAAATGQAEGDSDATNRCLVLIQHLATPAADGEIAVQSASSSQIVLRNMTALGHNLRISYLVIGGTGVEVETGVISEPAVAGAQAINTSITPNANSLVIFANRGSAGHTLVAPAPFGLGFATGVSGSVKQYSLACCSRDGNTNCNSNAYARTDECIADMPAYNTINARAAFAGLRTGGTPGFDLSWSEVSGTARLYPWVLIKGPSFFVDSFNTSTSGGGTIVESGFGFTPLGVFCASHGKAESTADTIQAHATVSLGAGTGSGNQHAQATLDKDGLGTSQVTTAIEHDNVHIQLDTTAGNHAVLARTGIQTLDSGGITFVQNTATGAAILVGYFAFGEPSTAFEFVPRGRLRSNTLLRM